MVSRRARDDYNLLLSCIVALVQVIEGVDASRNAVEDL
jgi:hypothetical protein